MQPSKLKLQIQQEKAFRFLWIKYVSGFNPRKHCAKCLAGPYSKILKYPKGYYLPALAVEGLLDEVPAPFIYLCGVTAKWEWNVHIVGKYQPDSRVNYSDDRINVEIENFEQFPIDASRSPTPAKREYRTCRNWQFGWCAFPDTPREPNLIGETAWNK